jgi:hypothetical protein
MAFELAANGAGTFPNPGGFGPEFRIFDHLLDVAKAVRPAQKVGAGERGVLALFVIGRPGASAAQRSLVSQPLWAFLIARAVARSLTVPLAGLSSPLLLSILLLTGLLLAGLRLAALLSLLAGLLTFLLLTLLIAGLFSRMPLAFAHRRLLTRLPLLLAGPFSGSLLFIGLLFFLRFSPALLLFTGATLLTALSRLLRTLLFRTFSLRIARAPAALSVLGF